MASPSPTWLCRFGSVYMEPLGGVELPEEMSHEKRVLLFYSLHLLLIYSLLPDCGQNVTSCFTSPQLKL